MASAESAEKAPKRTKRRNSLTVYLHVPREVHAQIVERASDARREIGEWIVLYAIEPALKKPKPKPLEVNP